MTGAAPHHQSESNYRQLPADYSSLSANYWHLHDFHDIGCLPLTAIYRQSWKEYLVFNYLRSDMTEVRLG